MPMTPHSLLVCTWGSVANRRVTSVLDPGCVSRTPSFIVTTRTGPFLRVMNRRPEPSGAQAMPVAGVSEVEE